MTMRYINQHYLSITIEKRTLYGALVVRLYGHVTASYTLSYYYYYYYLSIYLCRIQ